jgi:ABC-2 type transport system permease protein
MTDALRYEWVRLRTLRSTWWLTGLAVVATGVLALTALGMHEGPLTTEDYGNVITQPGLFFSSIFLSLIGTFSMGHEYRYGTIRPTLGAVPGRSHLMAAKVAIVLGWVALWAIVCEALNYLISALILGSRLTDLGFAPGPIGRVWVGIVGYITVTALIGLALATLTRSMPAAIVTLLVFPLIVENLLRALLSLHFLRSIRGVLKVLPFSAGQQIFSVSKTPDRAPDGFKEVPGPWTGALIFIIFMSILLGIAWTMFEKRDA